MTEQMPKTRDRDKPADLRLIVPRALARELRKRAALARRTLQAQALCEIERSISIAEDRAP